MSDLPTNDTTAAAPTEAQQPEESLETLMRAYRESMQQLKQNNWLQGDIALEITRRDASLPGKKILETFLQGTSEDRKSFENRRWVASRFPAGSQLRKLPVAWTLFRIAADADNPEYWLKKAHDEKWTTRKLTEELRAFRVQKAARGGAVCDCGCGHLLPESPVYLGGMGKGERSVYHFATLICVGLFVAGKLSAQAESVSSTKLSEKSAPLPEQLLWAA